MPALKGHSSIKVNSDCIMVFGGYNQLGQITDTCVILDLGSFSWFSSLNYIW